MQFREPIDSPTGNDAQLVFSRRGGNQMPVGAESQCRESELDAPPSPFIEETEWSGEAITAGLCGRRWWRWFLGIRRRIGGGLIVRRWFLDAVELVYFVGLGETSELGPIGRRFCVADEEILVFAIDVKDLHELVMRGIDELLAIAEG